MEYSMKESPESDGTVLNPKYGGSYMNLYMC